MFKILYGTHLGDRLPVANIVSYKCRDVVEPLPLQPVLHPGVGFVQHYHLKVRCSNVIHL